MALYSVSQRDLPLHRRWKPSGRDIRAHRANALCVKTAKLRLSEAPTAKAIADEDPYALRRDPARHEPAVLERHAGGAQSEHGEAIELALEPLVYEPR